MKTNILFLTGLWCSLVIMVGCQKNPIHDPVDNHTSKTSIDWKGVYKGTIPCADCEGIKTQITLYSNEHYQRITQYLGKEESPTIEQGNFEWDSKGAKIILTITEGATQQYLVGENVLFHLDKSGNRIDGSLANYYILSKSITVANLEDKKWILVELKEQQIESGVSEEPIHLIFSSKDSLISGFNGCNRFSGQYELVSGNNFRSGPFLNTLMACKDMANASTFIEVMEKADNFTIVDDILSLNNGEMATLARFKI